MNLPMPSNIELRGKLDEADRVERRNWPFTSNGKSFLRNYDAPRVDKQIPSALSSSNGKIQRPNVGGKFLFIGDEKFWVRGVTYGAFRPGPNGEEYYDHFVLERDFSLMAANGINAVRIPHTTPSRDVLDIAHKHGLRVMVGLSAEQYAGYLIDQKGAPDIEKVLREKARTCAGHPALLHVCQDPDHREQ